MSGYVLLVSLGPVQEFIAQARRTRDLWFGSHVLSEVSKAAARALAECDGVALVFPALAAGDPELMPSDDVRRADGAMPYSVANKLVAEVAAGVDVGAAARAARQAARRRLIEWGRSALERESVLVDEGASAVAEEQLATLLEVRAVWAPIGDGSGADGADGSAGYADARRRAEAALAARKTVYAFAPWSAQRGGCMKSSLDGARETVLKRPRLRTGGRWQRYRVGLREELDAVGLLKRTGGQTDQFVPIPNIGMAAWIDGLRAAGPAAERALGALHDACKARQLPEVRGGAAWVGAFPFDAQLFLPERWEPYLRDQLPAGASATAGEFGREYVMPLIAALRADKRDRDAADAAPAIGPEPSPYVACVVADGDHMGRTIDALAAGGVEHHRALSRALADFARSARAIIEEQHRGVLVYAGADDVLGFVCAQDALACAARLRECFAATLAAALERDAVATALGPDAAGAEVPQPTLSVGIGVGHIMQSLGHLLSLGREAEVMAKRASEPGGDDARDALAVIFERHSGATWAWRQRWSARPLETLQRDVARLLSGRLSRGKIHEIERQLGHLCLAASGEASPGAPSAVGGAPGGFGEQDARVLRGEVQRILSRTEAAPLTPAEAGLDLGEVAPAALPAVVARWAQRQHIALELSRVHRAAPLVWPAASECEQSSEANRHGADL
ncbi:MAG: type III-B CRISPR-associated protein Cas10/Cmr2 [Haliangiales bacterium]